MQKVVTIWSQYALTQRPITQIGGSIPPASILLRELALPRKFATQNKPFLTSTFKSEGAMQNVLLR